MKIYAAEACSECCGHDECHHTNTGLAGIVLRVLNAPDPRLALVADESGKVEVATTLPIETAVRALRDVIDRMERYGERVLTVHLNT